MPATEIQHNKVPLVQGDKTRFILGLRKHRESVPTNVYRYANILVSFLETELKKAVLEEENWVLYEIELWFSQKTLYAALGLRFLGERGLDVIVSRVTSQLGSVLYVKKTGTDYCFTFDSQASLLE